MEDLINGPMVDTLHSHHLLCTPPHSPHPTGHECMQCNFCLHLPTLTPRKGQSLGKFNEWISSFQDIRLAAKFPGLFTGIAIENMLTVLGRYLGLSINLTILNCQLYLKKSVEKTTIKGFHKLFHRQANPASVREKKASPAPNEVSLIFAF